MARYHAPTAEQVGDWRINSAIPTKPAKTNLRDHLECIPKATADQRVDALAYLRRKGLDDIAVILGLAEEAA